MNDYNYVVYTKEGKKLKGTISALSEDRAKMLLREQGFSVGRVTKQTIWNKDINISIGPAVTARDLSVFCRQFQSLLNAGVTVIDGLEMLSAQTENKTFAQTLKECYAAVQKGTTLADAMKKHPKVFPALLLNMIEAGEASGSLDVSFERMSVYFEKNAKLKALVKKAMIYPIMILIVAFVVLIAMEEFIDKVSNWYVRLGRKRYWGEEFTEDKKAAYVTLYTVLTTYAKLSAPFTPFMSEAIYQNLVRNFDKSAPVSVHLTKYPEVDETMVDESLSEQMALVYAYTELGRSARNASAIKNRQPLNELYLTDANNKTTLADNLVQILKDELNVKVVKQHEDLSKFVNYTLKPQLKTLGPKYGKKLNAIREFLANCDAMKVVDTVEKGEVFSTELDGDIVEFTKDDLLISVSQKEGYASATDGNIAVILDTQLTKELVEEGIYREFVSKVQNLRKSSNYVVTDRIYIEVSGDAELEEIVLKYENQVKQDVLALSVTKGENGEFTEEFNLNDKLLKVSIRR